MSDFKQRALDYHAYPTPGKIGLQITTVAETSEDLSLAYSPGFAEPCRNNMGRNNMATHDYWLNNK